MFKMAAIFQDGRHFSKWPPIISLDDYFPHKLTAAMRIMLGQSSMF
jgi:hypothetical protein